MLFSLPKTPDNQSLTFLVQSAFNKPLECYFAVQQIYCTLALCLFLDNFDVPHVFLTGGNYFPFKWRLGTSFQVFILKSEIGVHHKKNHMKISQFTKFEVLSFDCNHVEGFQKSEKLEPLYGFGDFRYLYGIWVTFDRSQPG